MPRAARAARKPSCSCSAAMATRLSPNPRAGRTSSWATQPTTSPESSATDASTTEASGPGTITSRARRPAAGRRASSTVMVEKVAVGARRPVARTAATATPISSGVSGSRGWDTGAVTAVADPRPAPG